MSTESRRPAKVEESNIVRRALSEIMRIRRGKPLITALVKMCYEHMNLCRKYLEE
jgi:hypothetical protein